uniref:Solute carrier family 5 member 1 n=1 Tax=Bos indicus x Bos taurus TaxID=30522 RepID=A0A4W2E8M6_BOBOX
MIPCCGVFLAYCRMLRSAPSLTPAQPEASPNSASCPLEGGVIMSCSRGTEEDFFLAGRSLVWWQIGAFLFASNIGTGHFMGLAGKGASSGIAVGAFEWNAAFILCALGWVFSPVYMKSGVVTLPRYLRKRFGGYRIQFLLAVLYLVIYIFSKISVEICTGAVFMRLVLGLDVYLATVVLLSVTGICSVTGGFAAVVYTDLLHAGFVVLGSVLLMGYDGTEALRTHE